MDQTWIRVVRQLPDAPVRLVCFPHAGGSASYYFPLAGLFGDRIEVLAVQYPGRHDRHREPGITELGSLADKVADVLAGAVEGPFAFFGHSMGAILAFEVTRRLEERGAPVPEVLFASGRRAPSVVREENVHRRGDAEVIAEMRRLGGTDASLLADPELLDMIMPALRADYTAIETYRCDPPNAAVGAPIEVLIGDVDPRVAVEDAKAWALHTTAACAIRVFSGGHFYLAERAGEVAAHVAGRLGLLTRQGQR
ncbi:alpha/beta fold hydrolase [Micromonospora sp. WMMD1120]|uniref:thioesterase II family protein n=1 Tax=Micromonospora sp. WMMD1120 TaxID=3016106 RepID=UPI0024165C8A|nr:alpha/beta fold hydrolase [Micromonospora sp. WMMD1120]MDG4810860.1 alpha/beta fold hydrolase [Micromonospora sp. WMMD1120]